MSHRCTPGSRRGITSAKIYKLELTADQSQFYKRHGALLHLDSFSMYFFHLRSPDHHKKCPSGPKKKCPNLKHFSLD